MTDASETPTAGGEHVRFAKFLITGGVAAGVNVVSRMLLSLIMSYEVAIVVAYLIGMATAYALAKLFVFEPSGRSAHAEFVRFALVNVVALAQVWIVSVGLARWLFPAMGMTWHAETIAHLIGVLSPAFTSYLGHKHFSFGRPR